MNSVCLAQKKIEAALSLCNKDDFRFIDCSFGGEDCVLVAPIGFPKWTQTTKYLRSCIYRKSDYFPISLGFPKFVNLGENPENFPPPKDLGACTITDKIDGSLLVVSRYNGQTIIRTRGSTGVESCRNSNEISFFKKTYSDFFNWLENKYCTDSYLWEWTSRQQKIVIDYGEVPKLTLINIINHWDYSLYSRARLEEFASAFPSLSLVKSHGYFNALKLDYFLSHVKEMKNFEGFCLYTDNEQEIFKVKSEDYLIKHRFKSNINFESMLDLYHALDFPSSCDVVLAEIEKVHDFECTLSCKDICLNIQKLLSIAVADLKLLEEKVSQVKSARLSRKECALEFANLKNPLYISACFKMLDDSLNKKEFYKKLINYYQNEGTTRKI